MSRTISRIGVGIAATALVFGATFAVAGSAMAAPVPTPSPTPTAPALPIIESTTTTFAAGNWGAGITATGTGFTNLPSDAKLVFVALSAPFDADPTSEIQSLAGGVSTLADGDQGVLYGWTPVTPDAGGTFTVTNWVPPTLATPLPAGNRAFMGVVLDGDGDLSTTDDITDALIGPGITPEITITPFVPLAQSITVTPICSSPEAMLADGVTVVATGFGQGEAITESAATADGVQIGKLGTGTADFTGTFTTDYTLGHTDGTPIEAGNYVETVVGANGLALTSTFTVGDCTVPAGDITPAAPALANTGSGDAGILIGGSALLLLVGGALVVARRRTAAAK